MAGGRERRFKLPRAARMRRRRDFARTVREGRAAAREAFVIHCLSVPGEGRLLGVVCGRRVGGAVMRNRVKRRLREIFRTHPEYFRDGFWFVAVAKPAIVDKDFHALQGEVTATLAGLTRGTHEKNSASD
ncbi:MAG: ribonuclease P protein component [candidate division Zixibacteria bacterium]|nr:ribonuclease P protein component [candidate division Zixibacteria bacterium]